jgi:histidyl-tRNA synthetase
MANTNPARGMRDFLPSDVRKREYVIGIIKEVYESYGFEPLETPAVENIETLTGKYGEEGNQLIFKILKRGEKLDASAGERELSDLALRYDLTVPLARVVANRRNDLPRFFKRYQIQPVWRADRPARGRFREFYQCDVDAIGSSSMIVEAELISAVGEILQRLGFDDYVIKLNHRNLLFDILERAGIPTERHSDALTAIDKLDKLSVEQVSNELINKGIAENSVKYVMNLYEEVAKVWNQEIEVNEILLSMTLPGNDLDLREQLLKIINLVGNPRVVIYPFLARGLSYYTGSIMEINVKDLAGSLGGGGRYDGLIGMFGKEQIPACGFSLGLERILVVMEERGMFPKELTDAAADVMVTIWNENSIGESLKLAGELRKEGLRVLVYPEADKLGKQFKYADSINVSFVCVVGETELAENTVTLKILRTGEQETVPREEISNLIKSKIDAWQN